MPAGKRTSEQEVQLANAQHRYPVDDLTLALTDLGYGFGTFMDWPVGPEEEGDTGTFDQSNPDHPYAIRNRQRRQDAATFFWMLAEGDPSLVTNEALAVLHRSLFDCSAAVRYDVSMALGHLNRPESGPFLERLLSTEPNSAMVKQVAQWAYSGQVGNVYGSTIADGAISGTLRPAAESDMVRDDNHISNMRRFRELSG